MEIENFLLSIIKIHFKIKANVQGENHCTRITCYHMFDRLLSSQTLIRSCSRCNYMQTNSSDTLRQFMSPNYVCQRTSHVANQASNVIHFFIMHNITSVFLLCKLFLLLFLGFPFLVLGYLGHLQPVGHLPVGMK